MMMGSHQQRMIVNNHALFPRFPAICAHALPGNELCARMQVRAHLVRDYHAREAADYAWQEGDVAWDERNTLMYPAICSLAGLVAGAFGVGGGVVKVCGSKPLAVGSRIRY